MWVVFGALAEGRRIGSSRICSRRCSRRSSDRSPEARPVEGRSRVGLAPGGDVAVAYDMCWQDGGEAYPDLLDGLDEDAVLGGLVGDVVAPLHLDTDGEVIAALAPRESGWPRMPRPLVKIHVLDKLAVAADQEVRGDAKIGNGTKIGMCHRVQTVLEQGVDPGSTKFAGWQADAMDHQQVDEGFGGALVPIGGGYASRGR